MKHFLYVTALSCTVLSSIDQSAISVIFVNEDSSPATIIIHTPNGDLSHSTGRKGSSVGPLLIPTNATVTIQGKGIGERTVPATMFISNPCCIISSVKEPHGHGKLALSIEFYPHKACSANT